MIPAPTDRAAPFRAIADSAHEWESWVDAAGRLNWVSPSVFRFTGYTPEECVRERDFPWCVIHEDDHATMHAVFDDAAAGSSGTDVEFRIRHRDGSLIWAAISWQPLLVDQGENQGYRTSVRDIQDRKRAEARVVEVEREAARVAAERAQLAANLSHDLRSPLQCILGISELLEQNVLDESKRRWVEIVSEQSTAVVRLVDDLVRFTAGGGSSAHATDERRASRPPPDMHAPEPASPPTHPPPRTGAAAHVGQPSPGRPSSNPAAPGSSGVQPTATSSTSEPPRTPTDPPPQSPTRADPTTGALRVLVVDDSSVARELLVAMLAHLGVTASQASSGEDALRTAATDKPNLVLIDYEMPALDGAETSRRLRSARLVEDGALIVLLTAHLLTAGLGEPSPEGFDVVMSKPLRLARLRTLLEDAEERARSRERDLLDPEVIEDLTALKDASGRSLLERRGPALLESLHDAVIRVERAAFGTSDVELRKAVHHLVGAAASLGARALSDEARSVERLAASGGILGSEAVARVQSTRLRELLAQSTRAIRASAGFGGGTSA